MPRVSAFRRGVKNPEAVAEFFEWLLNVQPDADGREFRFACANGALIVDGDASRPVAIELSSSSADAGILDPDGVPVQTIGPEPALPTEAPVRLDHVRLNCADLTRTTA